jgi:hypothetical protein
MAGVIQLMQGADPGTPGSNMEVIWAKNSGADGNGGNLANRLFAKDQNGNLYQLIASDRPNLIRNSGFWFAQRQGAATATTYSTTSGRNITADGWGLTNENASATYQRIDTSGAVETGLQGRYYGQFLKITSDGKLCVAQVVEGVDAQMVKNRVVRLQAWMKGAGGATPTIKFGVLELQNAGTLDAPPVTFISAFNGGGTNPTFGTNLVFLPSASTGDNVSITSNVAAATLTSAWQRFGLAVTVSSNCKNLIPVFFSDQQITATQGFAISQVSLTDGYEVQDWTPLSLEHEFARVRRFFQRSFHVDTLAPAQNVGTGTGELYGMAGKAGAAAEFITIRHSPPLRGNPTFSLFNPSAANAQMRDVTGAVDTTATATAASTAVSANITATGNAATAVGNQLAIHYTADAEI